MTQGKAVGLLGPGSHGSTYGGTVLGSRVVYTVIDTIQKENAVENAAVVGNYIVDQLRAQLSDKNVQVRGFGMMIGINYLKIVLSSLRLLVMNTNLLLTLRQVRWCVYYRQLT